MIGAGQRLLVGKYDVAPDATRFEVKQGEENRKRTGLRHRKVQRRALKCRDDSFSLSAYWEPPSPSWFQSPERITHIMGLDAGSRGITFKGVVPANQSHETPLGEFLMWTGEGTINGDVQSVYQLHAPEEEDAADVPQTAAGIIALYSAASPEYADTEGAWATTTLQLIVHAPEVIGGACNLRVYHANQPAGPWAEFDPGLRIAIAANAPAALHESAVVGKAWRRYVGLRVELAAAGKLNFTAALAVA